MSILLKDVLLSVSDSMSFSKMKRAMKRYRRERRVPGRSLAGVADAPCKMQCIVCA